MTTIEYENIQYINILSFAAPEQLRWQAQELGVLIHFNLETFFADGLALGDIPNPSLFDPYLLNTDNWVQTMIDFGAQYAVLVAKVRFTDEHFLCLLVHIYSMDPVFSWHLPM